MKAASSRPGGRFLMLQRADAEPAAESDVAGNAPAGRPADAPATSPLGEILAARLGVSPEAVGGLLMRAVYGE